MSKSRKSVAIIGGGPSALLAAAFLDTNKFDVTPDIGNQNTNIIGGTY